MPGTVLIVLMCALLGPPLAMGVGSVVAGAVTAVVRSAPSLPRPTPSHQTPHPVTPPASTRPTHPPTGTSATP